MSIYDRPRIPIVQGGEPRGDTSITIDCQNLVEMMKGDGVDFENPHHPDPAKKNKLDEHQERIAFGTVEEIHGPPSAPSVTLMFFNSISDSNPGSGKTLTLSFKLFDLIARGVDPNRICLLTYTRRGRSEYTERFYKLLPNQYDRSEKPEIRTFHSFATEFFPKNNVDLNFVEEKEIDNILKKIKKKYMFDIEMSDLKTLLRITRYNIHKHGRQYYDITEPDDDDSDDDEMSNDLKYMSITLFDEYNKEMSQKREEENKYDYTDLLLTMLEHLQNPSHSLHQRFDHILIDEAQDTDRYMLDIIKILTPSVKSITVVGNSMQQIYSWSGLSISFVEDFRSFLPNPRLLKLVNNRRCHDSIILGLSSIENVKPVASVMEQFEHRIFNLTSTSVFTVQNQWEVLNEYCPIFLNSGKSVIILFRRNLEMKSFHTYTKKKIATENRRNQQQQQMQDEDEEEEVEGEGEDENQGHNNAQNWLDNPRLTTSTCHSIKGAEADIVLVCNVIEMNIPLYSEVNANKKDNLFGKSKIDIIEEERKVFYVSVSRARELVCLISPNTIQGSDCFPNWTYKDTWPSDFCKILGDACKQVDPLQGFCKSCQPYLSTMGIDENKYDK